MIIQAGNTIFNLNPDMEYEGDINDTEAFNAFNELSYCHRMMSNEFTADSANLDTFKALLEADHNTAFLLYNQSNGRLL